MFWNKKKIEAEKYEPEKSVLPHEMTLIFRALKKVIRRDYIVLPHVSLGRILRPFGQEQKNRDALFAALEGHEADFVICTGETLMPLAVIVLGDNGKEFEPVFSNIGTRFVRIPMNAAANVDYLRTALDAFTAKNEHAPKTLSDTQTVLPRKYCETCRSEMAIKRANAGAWEGSLFWVCSRYPKCKKSELHKA